MKLFKTPRFFRILFPNKTWGFSRSINAVYLTFDDGPNPLITPWVLDLLAELEVKATFFCVGENVLKYPELAEDIKILKAKRKLNKIMIEAIKERLEREKEYDLFK